QGDLRKVMTTKPRRWFTVWRARPLFDPAAFRTDLDRLRQLYRSRGHYHVRVTYDLELPAAGDALVAVIFVNEGEPVTVAALDVTLAGAELPASERRLLLEHLPIARGRVFTEEAYGRAATYLRAYYREHGFARVEVTKQATVDLARDEARVAYRLESGPPCVFGETRITGTKAVDAAVPRRELAYAPGEPFKQSLLDRTRRNLVALNLFRAVRIEEDKRADPEVAVRIHLTEAPPREVRLGIGYDLLSGVEAQVKGALPGGAPGTGVLSGLGFGADWNTTDDLVDPTRGWVLGATVEPVGGLLGGDFNFVRLLADGRFYLPLVGGLLGAARFRLGTAEPYTRHDEVPLFERFYAGGIDSVRGYGRWRIGPL